MTTAVTAYRPSLSYYYRLGLAELVPPSPVIAVRPLSSVPSTATPVALMPAQQPRPFWTPRRKKIAAAVGLVAAGAATAWYARRRIAALESEARSAQVRHGFDSEPAMARMLQRHGADVGLSPGSRGPIDALAVWPNGRAWGIQLKASLDGEPRWPGTEECARVVDASEAAGARPVIALRSGKRRTRFFDATTRERIDLPIR